jgi:hypothetical protein
VLTAWYKHILIICGVIGAMLACHRTAQLSAHINTCGGEKNCQKLWEGGGGGFS